MRKIEEGSRKEFFPFLRKKLTIGPPPSKPRQSYATFSPLGAGCTPAPGARHPSPPRRNSAAPPSPSTTHQHHHFGTSPSDRQNKAKNPTTTPTAARVLASSDAAASPRASHLPPPPPLLLLYCLSPPPPRPPSPASRSPAAPPVRRRPHHLHEPWRHRGYRRRRCREREPLGPDAAPPRRPSGNHRFPLGILLPRRGRRLHLRLRLL